MSLPMALRPGTVVGNHYIIGSLINSGGFGAVYRGVDTSEGNRPCAIKETYDVTPASRRQALMEASVLFTVRSPHLPEVYDTLEANGRFYLIMQLIEGQNLLQLLRSRVPNGIVGEQEPYRQALGPCSEQEVLTWLLPIMDILQELHSRRPPVMHRDIKPGNIILTPHQTAVLVDFGLTRLYDPTRNTQTMTRAVTEGFSPLEQYVGKTSPQSDIYALAATMYLLLTNRMPPAATRRSMHDELIAPRLLNPSLTLETERVLLQALSLHAQDRYQSMHDFAEALQDRGFSSHSDPTLSVNPQRTGSYSLSCVALTSYAYLSRRATADVRQWLCQRAESSTGSHAISPTSGSAKGSQASTRRNNSSISATSLSSTRLRCPGSWDALPARSGIHDATGRCASCHACIA